MKIVTLVVLGIVPVIFARPRIRECRTNEFGNEYQGKANVTTSGIPCQPWSSQSPHSHTIGEDPREFPDSSMEDVSNYCRNPDDDPVGAWCYTMDEDVRYEGCDIPMCSDYPECRLTEEGTEYLGYVSASSTGSECLEWFGTEYPNEESNYCRNPDGRSTGPWCYVTADQAESCNVPFCKPSASCKRSELGGEYVGTVAWTVNGRVCQRWDTQYPHSHLFVDDDFPDGTVTDAQNFCRNPDDKADGPWCYTTDAYTEWEYCELPTCQECKATATERNYFGSVATTTSGFTCQRWDSQSPHPHSFTDPDRFPDASVQSASNFCRNPDGKLDGPWCYTSDTFVEWDYCDIPSCSGESSEEPLTPVVNHVVHIGIDGLRPDCIELAPGEAPTILDRLAQGGTYTLTNARTVLETVSGPGWSSHLCAMPMERTGIFNNGWAPPWMGSDQPVTPITGNSSAMPCVFQTLKSQDATIQTASLYDWSWIRWMSGKGYAGYVDKEIDCRDGYGICDQVLADDAANYLYNMFNTTEKSYTFVYYGNIDGLGHTYQWCLEDYNNGLDVVDAQVAQLLDAIDAAGKADETLVMLSSDHGGFEFGHGRYDDVDLLIPMFIKGPGIKVNHTFEGPVGNIDMIPTAARALGLKPSPWWRGTVMTEAFEDGVL